MIQSTSLRLTGKYSLFELLAWVITSATFLIILTIKLLPRGIEAFWTKKKEGRKGGVGKLGSAIQVKHVLLLKHRNVDSVYFSARGLNINAISKLFIMFVTDFWQCMFMRIVVLWNIWSLTIWQRNCRWKERETVYLVWEILCRTHER